MHPVSPQHYRHERKMRALHVPRDVIMVIGRPRLLCCPVGHVAQLSAAAALGVDGLGRGTISQLGFLG